MTSRDNRRRWRVPVIFAVTCSLLVGIASRRSLGQEPLHVRIDRLVEDSFVGKPAEISTDAEYVRRVHLDLTGRIPSVDEVRSFLSDSGADKRSRLVDRLIAAPEFLRHMTIAFDVMLMERRPDKHVPGAEWRQYLYDSFAQDKPLNQLAREILASDGVDPNLRPAAKFYLDRDGEPHLLTRDVGRLFFGMDLQCAQCHDHPIIDNYFQRDYHGLLAYMNRTVLFTDAKDKNKAYLGEKAEGDTAFVSVFTKEGGSTWPRLPEGREIEDPIFGKDDAYLVKPDKDVRPVARHSRRELLAGEATRGDNWAFNRNLANRLWALVMGRGLADPVDLNHLENPPANATLLDELARQLVATGFHPRDFVRELVLTRTYQRSIEAPADWRQEIAVAIEAIPALESSVAALKSELELAQGEAATLRNRRTEHEASIAALREASRQAEQVRADADKAARDAASALAASIASLESQRSVHATVAEALSAAGKAASLLPQEPELAAAVSKFQAASDKLAAAVGTLEGTLPDQRKAAEATTTALAAADQSFGAARDQYTTAAMPMAPIDEQLSVIDDRIRDLQDRWMVGERRLADARLAAETKPMFDAPDAAPPGSNPQAKELVEKLEEHWIRQSALAPLKPLSPEQLGWSILNVTGVIERQRAASETELKAKEGMTTDPGLFAREVEKDVNAKLEANVAEFVQLFGAASGQPQHVFFATVDQALFFDNGNPLRSWLAPAPGSVTDRMLKLEDPAAVAEELYLSVLARPPVDEELRLVRESLAAQPDQKAAVVQELAWALITSAEFRFSP